MKTRKAILNRVAATAFLASALCVFALPADAQSYTVLHPFEAPQQNRGKLVQASDGNFYGTTEQAGVSGLGSVFKVTPTGTLTTIYSFSGSDGQNPVAGLVQGIDGNLLGTTTYGGTSGYGTVFRIALAGALTTLHSFTYSDGGLPQAGLVQGTDGNFYGTTGYGGTSGSGTVFKLTPAGALTTLHSFASSGGENPRAGLVQGTDGNFYGTTASGGGPGSYGTVFKITPAGTLTTLYSFAYSSDGAYPYAGLVQGTDGNFYGTTTSGGPGGDGTVFRITTAGALTTLHWFAGSDGMYPFGGLVQGTDGNFYGTTYQGGASLCGTVFKITTAGALTTLFSFAGSDGASPYADLVQGTDGNFYGTTKSGGASGNGTVFKITPAGALTTLHSFASGGGAAPYGGLVQGTDGNFYGTTVSGGGPSGYGTVFKITPAGALTTLHLFTGSDGAHPWATLVQGTDGNFYGTTVQGGTSSCGTVFKITPAGALTTLHSFASSDGASPYGGLVQGTDGDYYGTTYQGGTSGSGTAFRITPAGALTTLHSFAGGEGSYPYAGLVQGTDGSFYGTTIQGGTSGGGTVFKITPAGALTPVHFLLAGSDGTGPYAGLVQGTDGKFYGTTTSGGANGQGTVFKITPAGVLTALHSFAGSDGGSPQSGLVQGTDGNFYGTTRSGGTSGYGTVFKITPAGVLTALHSFAGSDGGSPQSGLVQGTDGNFYGTTKSYGLLGGGVVFRLTPGPGPSPTVTGISPASGPVSGGTVVTISGTEFQPGATVSFGGVGGGAAGTGVTYFSATTIYALTPDFAAGNVTVTVTNPDLQAGSLGSAYTYICPTPPTPVITAPASTVAGTTFVTASVVPHAGSSWSWAIQNGTITLGQGASQIFFTAGTAGTPLTLSVTETNASGCVSALGNATVTVTPKPSDLKITKTHVGDFTRGQIGAKYTITVSNVGTGSTSGLITVTDAVPTGLTATSITSTSLGWVCTQPSGPCTNINKLGAGLNYLPLTLTVNVAGNAPASVTNTATVSGGGDTNPANNTANDPTTINPPSDLRITKTHAGNFTRGQIGAKYTITVSNVGTGSTSGLITVTDAVPTGLTATSITSTSLGWVCTQPSGPCTNINKLGAGLNYLPLTLTVNVAGNAPASVTNTATVSGGGDTNPANNTANDPTTINPPSDLRITKTHVGNFTRGQIGAKYTITVSNVGTGSTSGLITVTDAVPTGLTATSITSTSLGWVCTQPSGPCTNINKLGAGLNYLPLTLTVNVAGNAPASVTNTATVSGGGDTSPANNTASDVTTINPPSDLKITKTHVGNFTRGQIGAKYTITVSNVGTGSTSGVITVTDAVPAGLTATSIASTSLGWVCTQPSGPCTNINKLGAGLNYLPLTLTVNVAGNAPASVTNTATVSGGGDTNPANNTANDVTTINP